MNRLLALFALLSITGCGVAPETAETTAADTSCGFRIDATHRVMTSSVDPWNGRTGVVVASGAGSDGTFTIWGVDTTASGAEAIVWFMVNGTDSDFWTFESYPESRRWCAGPIGNGGAGVSPQNPPDNYSWGICVPADIVKTAGDWWAWGPWGFGNKMPHGSSPCDKWGEGGCVPKSCAEITGCGPQPNGCRNSTTTCRECPPPPPDPPHHCPAGAHDCGDYCAPHGVLCQ